MKAGKTTAIIALTGALVCGGFGVRSQAPVTSAIAATGFAPYNSYPHRDQSYDHLLQPAPGLQQWQLEKLFYDISMPQSHGAMVSFLGYPTAEDGSYSYWAIGGGSSELAVFYLNGKAQWYTVGY